MVPGGAAPKLARPKATPPCPPPSEEAAWPRRGLISGAYRAARCPAGGSPRRGGSRSCAGASGG